MRLKVFTLMIFTSALLLMSVHHCYSQTLSNNITDKAIWNASEKDMQKIVNDCGATTSGNLGNCLYDIMTNSGASKKALEFTQMMDNRAYMNGFHKLGSLDVAFVYFPFKDYEREGCVIVNGKPDIINVDDPAYLPMDSMQSDPDYEMLQRKYKHISLYAVNRKGTEYPFLRSRPKNIKQMVVNYRLTDGCYNCGLLGFAEFGFDFDSTGKFISCKFLKIKSVVQINESVAYSGEPSKIFSDPIEPINISSGEKFAIVISSNHSQNFKWQLGKPFNKKILSLQGTNYILPHETLPNAPGKELWYFTAVGKGTTEIQLRYVRTWNAGTKSFETYTFTVNVE